MAKPSKALHIVRDILVILTTLMMIATLVFQCCEISTYQIGDHIQSTLFDPIKAMINGDGAKSAPAAATDPAATGNPAAPPAPGNPMAPPPPAQ